MTLSRYAAKNISELIEKVTKAAADAEKEASEDCIHDLRVAIRRLSEMLRVFEDVCPDGTAAKVRKDLREAMRLAGTIRNHDIARDLATKAKAEVNASFDEERAEAVRELIAALSKWKSGMIFKRWRTQLRAKKTGQRT